MAGKPDKERMGQNMKYVIDSKTYENHINDEVHLYGLLHQLAFLAEKAKDEKDLENLAETAKRYGEIAEEKFSAWRMRSSQDCRWWTSVRRFSYKADTASCRAPASARPNAC